MYVNNICAVCIRDNSKFVFKKNKILEENKEEGKEEFKLEINK